MGKKGGIDWVEEYRQTQEYREKVWKEKNGICFSTRIRNKVRKKYSKMQEEAMAALEAIEAIGDPSDIQVRKTKLLWEWILDFAGSFVEGCDRAESNFKALKITNCRYCLYKKKKGTGYIFEYFFYRPIEKRSKKYCLVIKSEILVKDKEFLIRQRCSKSGYEKIDEGPFRMKIKSFEEVLFEFKGRKPYDIDCKAARMVEDYDWILSFI